MPLQLDVEPIAPEHADQAIEQTADAVPRRPAAEHGAAGERDEAAGGAVEILEAERAAGRRDLALGRVGLHARQQAAQVAVALARARPAPAGATGSADAGCTAAAACGWSARRRRAPSARLCGRPCAGAAPRRRRPDRARRGPDSRAPQPARPAFPAWMPLPGTRKPRRHAVRRTRREFRLIFAYRSTARCGGRQFGIRPKATTRPRRITGHAHTSRFHRRHRRCRRRLSTACLVAVVRRSRRPDHVVARATVLGANDRVRVGVIGTGRQGTGVMRGHQRLADVEIAAICDVYAPNLAKAAEAAPERGQARRLPAASSTTRPSTRSSSPRPITGTR